MYIRISLLVTDQPLEITWAHLVLYEPYPTAYEKISVHGDAGITIFSLKTLYIQNQDFSKLVTESSQLCTIAS